MEYFFLSNDNAILDQDSTKEQSCIGKQISIFKGLTLLKSRLKMDNKDGTGFKSHSNQHAPWSGTNLAALQLERLLRESSRKNEDIFSLKLKSFEAQIKINQKNDEIQRLKEVINNKLMFKPNNAV